MPFVYRFLLELALQQVVEACARHVGRRAAALLLPGDVERPPCTCQRPEGANPRVSVVSCTPGRVRLRIPEIRADRARHGVVLSALRSYHGVVEASGSTATGTVLVHHNPEHLDAYDLEQIVQEALEPTRQWQVLARPVLPAAG
jgi:hypothetical protein